MTVILRQRRSLSMAAIAVLLIVYAAVLVLMLAPRGTFSAIPGSLIQPDD